MQADHRQRDVSHPIGLPGDAQPFRNRLRAALTARVGFWRALLEITLVANLLSVLLILIPSWLPSPWGELIGYIALAIYVLAAWRLGPGAGPWWRRALRLSAWIGLFSLINGVSGWLIINYLPSKGSFLGMDYADLRGQLSVEIYLLSSLLVVVSLFLPARLLMAAWALGRRRLRWQLTFAYLLIGVLTNFLMPLALLVYLSIISLSTVPAIMPPADLGPRLADALGPTVRDGISPGQLNPLLEQILAGTARLPLPADTEVELATDLTANGVRRISLLHPDGSVLASAGREPLAAGEALDPTVSADLRLLWDAALAEGRCVGGRPADSSISDWALCPIGVTKANTNVQASGAPAALLLIESNIDSAVQVGAAFGRIISLTLLGFNLTLNVAAFIILAIVPFALGGGYLLARRLTRRIERLTAATADIAAGNLGRQIEDKAQDEIGRLGADFNAMAARLAERERALADAAARAEALLRTNRRLVADVSHELRNPLATLRGYLEALEQQHGSQLPAHDMQVIQREMQRLTGLVDDLFTLARAEAQQLPLTIEAVDAGDLAQRLAATLAPLARREREIALVAQIPAALPLVRADRTRLEQVLRNLAQNALRHTPPGGIIVFEAQAQADGTVALAVADTGMGISPEDLPHVFDRFFRGDSSRARETGGAGLGLALVRELVDAMGGGVTAESTIGRGSRFTVTLQQFR